MKRTAVISLVILASACATLSSRPDKIGQKDLLIGATYLFYDAMIRKDYGQVYDMLTPTIRKDSSREAFTAWVNKWNITVVSYTKPEVVLFKKNRYAVTQSVARYVIEGVAENYCERTVWMWANGHWRLQAATLVCDYMPDKKDLEYWSRRKNRH